MIAGLGLIASVPRSATADETRNETTTKRESTSGNSTQQSVRKSGGGSASASSSSSASGNSFGLGAGGSGGRAGGQSSGGGASGSSARAAAQASLGESAPARTEGASADKTDSSRATTKRVGKRTITTVDQDARTIVIIESPTRLSVQVIEHEPEDAPPKTFSAPNADALQAKHPEAYRLYQEHVLNRRERAGSDVAAAPGAGVLGDLPAGLPGLGDLPRIDGEVDVKQLLERQLREVREKVDSPELRQLIDEQLRELRP